MATSRELLDTLGWTKQDPRSAYDRAVFLVLEQLVREVEELRAQVDLGGAKVLGDPA